MRIKHLFYLFLALPLMMVACEDSGEEVKTEPSVTVTAGTADTTTLTFSVEAKNAESAAWLVFASDETEPSAAEILQSGTAIDVQSVATATATDLNEDTEYCIVAAAAGNGMVAKSEVVKMTTLKSETPADPTTLELTTEAEMSFDANGGDGTIGYELKNPNAESELTAESNEDWITIIDVAEVITFTVAANEAEEAREAKITVAYDELSFDVTVKQAGMEAKDEPIESFDITFTSASYIQTSGYGDAEIYQFRNEDGFQANIYFELSNSTPLTPGVYSYSEYAIQGVQTYSAADCRVTIIDEKGEKQTGLLINSGDISVAVVDGQYNIEFDLTISYNSSTPFKATFTGTIANDTVWEEGVEPEPAPEFNAWDSATLVSNAGGSIAIAFGDSTNAAELHVIFYTNESYLPAAAYAPGMPNEGCFSVSSYLTVNGEKFYYNTDGANGVANDINVELADDNTYTFTFNDMTFGSDKLVKGSWSGQIEGLKKDEGGNDDFAADYVIKKWMWAGYSSLSWGNYYNISGDNISMQVHFCTDAAQETTLTEGEYVWTSTTGISNSYPERFALRSVTIDNMPVTIKGGSVTVSAEGDVYTINMTLNSSSDTYKVQYVGKLNDENAGGDEGGEDNTITLTTLTYAGYNSSYYFEQFTLSDGGNNSLDMCFNEYQANASKIYGGEYEWITISQVGYDYGYFATNNIVVNGASKKANGGLLNIIVNEDSGTYTFDFTLDFNDGTSQKYTFSGPLS